MNNHTNKSEEETCSELTKTQTLSHSQIENSCPMDYSMTTDGLLSELSEEVFQKLLPGFYPGNNRLPSEAKQKQLRMNVGLAIANLFMAFMLGILTTSPSTGFYLSVDKKKAAYSGIPTRYKSGDITYTYLVDKVINPAIQLGLIEQHLGYKPKDGSKQGYRTRIKAAGWLLQRFEEIRQSANDEAGLTAHLKDTEVIRLKNDDKKLIDYKDTSETESLRANLERFNDYLKNNVKVSLNGHFLNTGLSLYRVFNNSSFAQGGRFFGGSWQILKSVERPRLIINGERTVELDYASLHLTVLYNLKLNREVPKGDLYSLHEYGIGHKGDKTARKVSKLGALIMFNSASKNAAMAGLNTKLRKMRRQGYVIPWDAKEIIEAFMEKHKDLSDFFCTAHGLELQRLDSTIVDQILVGSVEDDIPVLPVHDSFIVRERDQKWLLDIMKSEYEEIIGFVPKVHAA